MRGHSSGRRFLSILIFADDNVFFLSGVVETEAMLKNSMKQKRSQSSRSRKTQFVKNGCADENQIKNGGTPIEETTLYAFLGVP